MDFVVWLALCVPVAFVAQVALAAGLWLRQRVRLPVRLLATAPLELAQRHQTRVAEIDRYARAAGYQWLGWAEPEYGSVGTGRSLIAAWCNGDRGTRIVWTRTTSGPFVAEHMSGWFRTPTGWWIDVGDQQPPFAFPADMCSITRRGLTPADLLGELHELAESLGAIRGWPPPGGAWAGEEAAVGRVHDHWVAIGVLVPARDGRYRYRVGAVARVVWQNLPIVRRRTVRRANDAAARRLAELRDRDLRFAEPARGTLGDGC